MDVDGDGQTDVLLVAAPMFYSHGWETGKVYSYRVKPQVCTHRHITDRFIRPMVGACSTVQRHKLEFFVYSVKIKDLDEFPNAQILNLETLQDKSYNNTREN